MTSSIHFAGELAQITVRQSDAWSLNGETWFFGAILRAENAKEELLQPKRLVLKSGRWRLCGSQAAVDQHFKVFVEMNQSI